MELLAKLHTEGFCSQKVFRDLNYRNGKDEVRNNQGEKTGGGRKKCIGNILI